MNNLSILSLLFFFISFTSISCSDYGVSNKRSQRVEVKKDGYGVSSNSQGYRVTVFCHKGENRKVSMQPKNISKSDLTIGLLRCNGPDGTRQSSVKIVHEGGLSWPRSREFRQKQK